MNYSYIVHLHSWGSRQQMSLPQPLFCIQSIFLVRQQKIAYYFFVLKNISFRPAFPTTNTLGRQKSPLQFICLLPKHLSEVLKHLRILLILYQLCHNCHGDDDLGTYR